MTRRPLAPVGLVLMAALLVPEGATAQIERHPTGVNVNAQGATTVFITFSNLSGYEPVEAIWCGALVSATPDVGDRCDPGTIYGALPVRFAQTRPSGTNALTDIMSIPPSVARRAYQAAASGDDSRFFYVRRFVDPSGLGPDQFLAVTCRLSGGGARTPFSLLDVRLAFATEDPVLAVATGEQPAPVVADISYNGTGSLVGRWEVVRPGEAPPTAFDLLTEGALPLELRGTQRRYLEIERFNIFLAPTGRIRIKGPDLRRLPTDVPGLYQIVLRIEASDDKEGDSDLSGLGAGSGVAHNGAVAGFPIPALRYVVGDGGQVGLAGTRVRQLFPAADSVFTDGMTPVFSWTHAATAFYYRLEVREVGDDTPALEALLTSATAAYKSPPWILEQGAAEMLEWRVVALDTNGESVQATGWRRFAFGASPFR